MRFLGWMVLLLMLASLTQAGVFFDRSLSLQPSADTTLFQTQPEQNLGAVTTLIAGTTAGGQSNRALLRFDVSGSLPPRAHIRRAVLSVQVVKTTSIVTQLFRLHRLNRDWTEGIGADGRLGQPALPGECTWNFRSFPAVSWDGPGATGLDDYAPESSAQASLYLEGAYEFASSNLTADVQRWQTNAADNFGWILVCDDEAELTSARRFGSREDPDHAPRLLIEYSLPEREIIGLSPDADAALFQYHPDYNLGASDLAAGSIGLDTNRSRALFHFDLSSIPPEAVITAARFQIYVTRAGSGPDSIFRLHRLRQSWEEGDKVGTDGSLATEGESTWLYRSLPLLAWDEPGGSPGVDYAPEFNARQLIGGPGWWEFPNVVEDVRTWVRNPGTNYGWIMISEMEDTPRTARRFASRESSDNSPLLEIEYLLPPAIGITQADTNTLNLSFSALAWNHYSVECRPSLGDGAWETCTNLPEPESSGPYTISLPAPATSQFYRVALHP